MQYTLYLSGACNLSCAYCGASKSHKAMNKQTAYKAIDLALSGAEASVGIGFYGGEPLLHKDLIADIINYIKGKNAHKKVFLKLTTNGLLLDDAFLQYAQREGVLISLSLDGTKIAHDKNRKDRAGQGSYDALLPIIPKLLKDSRYTAAMMTLAPNAVPYFCDSAKHIYSLGFMNIICSLDYSAQWSARDLSELSGQYKKLADFYYESTLAEKKFFFSPFDSKIDSHINRKDYRSQRCKLGYEQICVAADGSLYPCIQFIDDPLYKIGDVEVGINQKRRKEIYELSQTEHPACKKCAVRDRCLHSCACINKYSTGDITQPSPILCATQKMLIPIADGVAARLYKKRSGMFIQKHYNEMYSLVSLVEDSQQTK